MEKLSPETEKIMSERFGKDNVIALATTENDIPYVRNVNAFYEDKAFYIITHALSNKMKQLTKNPPCCHFRRMVHCSWNWHKSGIFREGGKCRNSPKAEACFFSMDR